MRRGVCINKAGRGTGPALYMGGGYRLIEAPPLGGDNNGPGGCPLHAASIGTPGRNGCIGAALNGKLGWSGTCRNRGGVLLSILLPGCFRGAGGKVLAKLGPTKWSMLWWGWEEEGGSKVVDIL